MKQTRQIRCIVAAIILVIACCAEAQEADAGKEIETSLGTYFASVSARDVGGVRAVLASTFSAVEARESAVIHAVNTANDEEIIPVEGNGIAGLKFAFIKAEVSKTDPSVAVASFRLTLPQTEEQLASIKAALATTSASKWSEKVKLRLQQTLADKAMHFDMFAMLARQDGKWKILCMSFPG